MSNFMDTLTLEEQQDVRQQNALSAKLNAEMIGLLENTACVSVDNISDDEGTYPDTFHLAVTKEHRQWLAAFEMTVEEYERYREHIVKMDSVAAEEEMALIISANIDFCAEITQAIRRLGYAEWRPRFIGNGCRIGFQLYTSTD